MRATCPVPLPGVPDAKQFGRNKKRSGLWPNVGEKGREERESEGTGSCLNLGAAE